MKSLYGGSVVWMTLPVDAALEKQAIKWLDEKHSREQAVRALGHFKSDANIARVKKLVADPDAEVQKAARDVLKSWHISQP